MDESLEMVNKLSDTETVMAAKEFYETAFDKIDFKDVKENSAGFSDLQDLLNIDKSKRKVQMSPSDTIELSRMILQIFAADTGYAPAIKEICENVKNRDDLLIGAVVAVGLIVNLTLLLASTSIIIEKDSEGKVTWKIEKSKSPIEAVKAAIGAISKVAGIG